MPKSSLVAFLANPLRKVAWFVLDWFGLVWIGLDWFGLVWIGLDWFGLVWIGLDWFGLVWIGLDWFGLAVSLLPSTRILSASTKVSGCNRVFGWQTRLRQ